MATSELTVAKTILAQLGGNRFIAMTGAKMLAGDATSLQFRLPSNFATNGINSVRIILDPSDTYTVKFGKIRGTSYKIVSEHSDVYCDMLQELFTRVTGLDTHL